MNYSTKIALAKVTQLYYKSVPKILPVEGPEIEELQKELEATDPNFKRAEVDWAAVTKCLVPAVVDDSKDGTLLDMFMKDTTDTSLGS